MIYNTGSRYWMNGVKRECTHPLNKMQWTFLYGRRLEMSEGDVQIVGELAFTTAAPATATKG